MDALERLAAPGRELFGRVDAALVRAGAPDAHPIWPLLRSVGALPGDAVSAVLALCPVELHRAAVPLRMLAEEYRTGAAAAAGGWVGSGAEAFAAHWSSLAAHLGGPDESLAARLRETADLAESLADWMAATRATVAATLAEALGSTEAVALITTGRPGAARLPEASLAAATLGARVLATVSGAYDEGERLRAAWSGRLTELRYRPPTGDGPPRQNILRVPL